MAVDSGFGDRAERDDMEERLLELSLSVPELDVDEEDQAAVFSLVEYVEKSKAGGRLYRFEAFFVVYIGSEVVLNRGVPLSCDEVSLRRQT